MHSSRGRTAFSHSSVVPMYVQYAKLFPSSLPYSRVFNDLDLVALSNRTLVSTQSLLLLHSHTHHTHTHAHTHSLCPLLSRGLPQRVQYNVTVDGVGTVYRSPLYDNVCWNVTTHTVGFQLPASGSTVTVRWYGSGCCFHFW